jgi:hypothetical protein
MGYIRLNVDLHFRDPNWWWKGMWKLKCPLKYNIVMWCFLVIKFPTWEVLKKIKIVGRGWCPLCKAEEETQAHFSLLCSFIKNLERGILNEWVGFLLEREEDQGCLEELDFQHQ